MADIKTREHSHDIKVLDKSAVAGERMKNAFVRSKEQAKDFAQQRACSGGGHVRSSSSCGRAGGGFCRETRYLEDSTQSLCPQAA